MTGKVVGVLKYRLHDTTIILQQGGILLELENNDTIHGIVELFKRLERKDIDGFLLNRNTYHFFSRRIETEKYKNKWESIRHVDMFRTVKHIRGGKLSAGILVRDYTDYKYFKKYFDSNRVQLEACNSIKLNYKPSEIGSSNSFSPDGGLFRHFLYFSLGILGVIAVFGILYEIQRHRMAMKTKKEEEDSSILNIRNEFYSKYSSWAEE